MNTKLFITSVLASAFIAHSGQALAAQYKVTEITPLDEYRQHFSMGLNDSGTVVGVVRDRFNFPFYNESYIANYKTSCGLSDSEIASGQFDASSTYCLKSVLAGLTGSTYQKIGDSKSFIYSGNDPLLTILTDVVDNELGDYTNSNVEQLNAINSSDMAVGTASAPFLPVDFSYTNSTNISTEIRYWQRDYKTRGVVYANGTSNLIEPAFNDYGGLTSAVDISDSGYVAGYSSTALYSAAQTSIETDCDGDGEPLLVCVWTKQQAASIYITRPYIWQVDDSGEVISSTEYALAIDVEDSDTSTYSAVISALNESGVGVGYGHVYNSDDNVRIQPLFFGSDGTESLIDNDLYDAGYASDINNSNIVVGKVQTYYNSTYNDQFFVYDILNNEFQTPDTFYTTAESSANAINDLGKVIGEAEYEVTTDTTRRKHGFIYDINTRDFFDINDLLECNSGFEIVEMKDINNSNQIAATALKSVPLRDSAGEVAYDSYGEAYTEQVTVSVLLSPISGEIDNCSDVDEDEYERKGLSSTPILLIFLSALLYIRRRSI